ncbi:Low-density lipoprotein receptor-related protein 1B [Frankliniella fusca]|uniref:Low-density lipoprotein receptor-related protein 1B n=1 Tax=Frankliniella fusca TaxID=407009 RepID=A0AAE1LKK1_9NEOP|nr:Low-density lipoprotein receptor-related protein 1B [Frankliniella fusca]
MELPGCSATLRSSFSCFIVRTEEKNVSTPRSPSYALSHRSPSNENLFLCPADSIATLCKDYFRQQQLRKIDGAELRSQNERNLNCVITFQTHSILQSFMLRFDELTLDCNDHLYIYDGAHAVGLAKWDLSCRDTREMVGPIHTRTNHVTLKYVTDNWGTENFGFNLIITAVKDPRLLLCSANNSDQDQAAVCHLTRAHSILFAETSCNDFKCKTREFCIHTDLVCDGVSHCADGSDETAGEKCGRGDIGLVLGMSVTYLVVACVSAVLILGLAGVGVVVCFYRQGPGPAQLAGNSFQPVHHGGLNGTGHTGAGLNHGNTSLPRGPGPGLGPPLGPQPLGGPPAHTLSLMQPGNWLCPVGTQLGDISSSQKDEWFV